MTTARTARRETRKNAARNARRTNPYNHAAELRGAIVGRSRRLPAHLGNDGAEKSARHDPALGSSSPFQTRRRSPGERENEPR